MHSDLWEPFLRPDHQDSADDHRKCRFPREITAEVICTIRRLPPNSERQKNKMKIAIASFTRNGCAWNRKLCAALKNTAVKDMHWKSTGKKREFLRLHRRPAWTERMFQKMDAILFIGACGIAVRSIAPYIEK